MFQRVGGVFFAAAVVVALAVPVRAAGQAGTIAVTVDSGLTDVVARRLMLYRVGEETDRGYEITEEFGGGLVFRQDAFSPHLARMLAQTQGSSGRFQNVDGDNTALFSNLEPGLYLLMEDAADAMILPCMAAVPMNGQWDVQAYPAVRYYAAQNPSTGQHPGPILGAVGMVLSGIGLAVCAGIRRKK